VRSGKYKQVAYYPGCALEGTGHAYNRSTKELGKALGLDIVETQKLELLRRHGSQEHRSQIADLSVGATALVTLLSQ
jgi:heterodisulfide reductase subunit B